MFHQRYIFNFAARLILIGITLGGLSAAVLAQGVTVKTDQVTLVYAQWADFGSGVHLLGRPTGSGSVTWEYSTIGGSLVAKATIKGTLYVDSFDYGPTVQRGARLIISFQNAAQTEIGFRFKDLCCALRGGNANDPHSQLSINESFASSELTSVFLGVTGLLDGGEQGRPWEPLARALERGANDSASTIVKAPGNKKYDVIVNNGNNDFGGEPHAVGSPVTSGLVQLTRDKGQVTGHVKGTLYWDALFGGGCTRLIIDFQNLNGTTLSQKTIDRCGTGGNANDAGNKLAVDQSFTSGSLMQIRLRVGTVLQDGSLRNVVTNNYGWK
jgi:hypothetical protein